MLLQLRVLKNEEFAEGEVYRFQGQIVRLSWESDGRLSVGRSRRPLLVFYQYENGCRVRCVPTEAVRLNGLPLEGEQRLSTGDQLQRTDGWIAQVSNLMLRDGQQEVPLATNAAVPARLPSCLAQLLIAALSCAAILGSTLGAARKLPDAIALLKDAPADERSQPDGAERSVRDIALNLKEALSQTGETRSVSVDELLVQLAYYRNTAQQLALLHPRDELATTVASALNSFYQLSAGLGLEDPEFFPKAIDAANSCLTKPDKSKDDELSLFFRSLAAISLREARARLVYSQRRS
ncbi:hypothetical protein [Gloeobacter kilaueensis]|uniref:Uncharacterized protein n=1 Tax=Gloeobacter kilaueensis (strain ATCC BAA-2537 / CCAP 1431/1 / ULC 316 / JS1) TaxID=1183438 RepID=U5QI67_GLOK1|nr:hypothetical protein [Gloeobacter kilaueensis]AGY58583.1 hypothetical protein GKIL_2337 [Gloeobacter kilaueensis JS1]